ncbi:tRNA pseudouridine(38-40) synthase TruA [Selenomonas sp. oral taxon 149]|uniref:tRNA pseudouridine(38-40) synthase TruA n=1 Tax=Selenomonas sp. oral taxon 149 TaxID=712535 RepID=UPI0006831739|nr:tRNA pseudouridine(38-40) synthase TruA [Selenomonas sp. oral taxon 149]
MKARARNIALKVAYDGTNYHGFQRQTPPIRAVQNVLEAALAQVCGETVELASAGRTDAGVHAYGQVVNFFTDGRIPTERLPRAVNGLLPPDIVVSEAWEAARDFSARHSATGKAYVYRMKECRVPDPFTRSYAWQIFQPLDYDAMRAALHLLEGTHDYSSFRAAGGAPMSPVRTLDTIRLTAEGEGRLSLYIHGTGFLYHMVRNIVSTAVAVGTGRISKDRFAEIFAARDRRLAPPTAPAGGLYLLAVDYDGTSERSHTDGAGNAAASCDKCRT